MSNEELLRIQGGYVKPIPMRVIKVVVSYLLKVFRENPRLFLVKNE